MKKTSGWAAILFAPTLIGAIGLMVGLAVLLYTVFKVKKRMWPSCHCARGFRLC